MILGRPGRPPPPAPPLRITARGFTNLQRGRGGCASKRRERELQVGRRDRPALAQTAALLPLSNRRDGARDGPSPKRRPKGGAMRKRAVIRCGGALRLICHGRQMRPALLSSLWMCPPIFPQIWSPLISVEKGFLVHKTVSHPKRKTKRHRLRPLKLPCGTLQLQNSPMSSPDSNLFLPVRPTQITSIEHLR